MVEVNCTQIERVLDLIGKELWKNGGHGLVLDGVVEALRRLTMQATVQRDLERTAKILRHWPIDKTLPNQMAAGFKRFINWVFEHTDQDKEKQARLRELNFNALKFCGLCYTLKQITELSRAHFGFLIEKSTEYVELHGLSRYLYRADVNERIVNVECQPEDDELWAGFQNSQLMLRPKKRKRDEDEPPTMIHDPTWATLQGQATAERLDGEVYTLTTDDLVKIVLFHSDQIGEKLMTIPLSIRCAPFVNAQISNKISNIYQTRSRLPEWAAPHTPNANPL